ncbi:DUF456 domain-containing protein [Methyloversatilis sp.]|uniref:DUF456 domain-containing protein n=1 Tax=Methyloversatilis sp. TaxID=2569862 RepID=UPI002735C169|nr:DUF456 domain-containing protein [Methyloversatilis sp.]MDP2870711.1 DUF456 domain-containing protein [Methyloversatilis sp.]MDP3289904.1 DUF456 domain-containing protein [Methyloversatilis sp.]MDP3455663.1 DUF456 domain-containing protein [Methyloversatilis sp.]MDP3577524.1 DUF456 domain-containing protein [Methyloversatilis sp.]
MSAADLLLWLIAGLLVLVGLAGVILPALPGIPLVFGGLLMVAWLDDFQRIGGVTLAVLGALAVLAWLIDFAASVIGAQRVGASPLALVGAAIGTVVGLFGGLIGLLFAPLAGAAIGEFIARRDALQAARVGLATWLGMLLAAVAKVAIAFMMLGIALAAWLF